MSIIRTFSRQLASNGFKLSILLLAITTALLAAFGSPQVVKDTLHNSGVYNTLPNTVVKQVTNDNQGGQTGDGTSTADENATLQQPEVQSAAKDAFNPAFLQSSSDQIVDGTYHWLDGTTANPDFKVDLTPAINAFEDKAATAATDRVKKLPACTLQQLREINPATADPFQLTCLPPGFNADAQRQAAINSLTGKNEFLQNPILTADRIPKDDKGQTVFERASMAPKVFHWLTIAPWIFGVLALLFGVGILFLNLTRRRGIGSLGISFVINGLLLLVLGILAGFIFNRFFNSSSSPLHLTDSSVQESVVNIIGAFNHIITRTLLIFGGIYTAAGVATLVILHFTKPKQEVTSPLDERRAAVRN